MIKHIVVFKMKIFESDSELESSKSLIRIRLLELPELIKEIVNFEIGINESNSPRAYDIVLISEFKNYDDLKKYQVHPKHLSVVEIIKDKTESTIVVDYKIE